MEIILKEDVANLGYKDDIVIVKNGYGRNYLIPTGKAVIASPSAKKVLAENLKQRAHKIAAIKAAAEELGNKLNGAVVTISTKVDANGTIYGSVNAAQVAEKLQEQGFEIDRKIINIKETIKTAGEYVATVKLHKEVSADVKVIVVAEEA
ncbi:MAG: 50S ribosomal protein L9 [Paludibacteraceae bacterium]|nr:50S ribosomal protein L9 [Paludibacteraceae bacterium]